MTGWQSVDRVLTTGRAGRFSIGSTSKRTFLAVAIGAYIAISGIIALLLMPPEIAKKFLHYILFVNIFVLLFTSLWFHRFAQITIVRPSFVSIAYLGLAIALGAWAFSNDYVVRPEFLAWYYHWENVSGTVAIVISCLFAMFLASLSRLSSVDTPVSKMQSHSSGRVYVVMPIFLFAFFAALLIHDGVISQIKLVIFCAIFLMAFSNNIRYKYALMSFCIVALATVSSHDKREAIFVLLIVAVLAMYKNPLSPLKRRHFIYAFLILALTIPLILMMSIYRGYGGYDIDGFFSTLYHLQDYVAHGDFIAYAGANFEFNYTFQHMMTSTSTALRDSTVLELGSTYLRILFLGPIGLLLNYKPDSILEAYTSQIAPAFRAVGGSWPPTSIGEAAWNFGMFAAIPIFIIYRAFEFGFDKLLLVLRQRRVMSSILGLCALKFFLEYTRGSGLDMFVAHMIFAAAATVAIGLPTAFAMARRKPIR